MPRPLDELIDTDDPAWPLIAGWLQLARNDTEVVSTDRQQGTRTLELLQVTTRSPLGAIALETGGLLIDRRWLRVLGSDDATRLEGLAIWNGMTATQDRTPLSGGLLVAHDAIGGFFAINGGSLPGEPGETAYFAPDTVRWEPLGLGYSAFLHWCLTEDLDTFYEPVRWAGWEHEVAALGGDEGLHILPPLWAHGPALESRSRRPVPMVELWELHQQAARDLLDVPHGARVRLSTVDASGEVARSDRGNDPEGSAR